MGNSTVGPNVTNWWEKQKEKLFPTNPWNRKPAWELTPTKNDILDFQRAQLSDKYGGDFSSWTPEGAFAYSYGQKTENKQNTDPGGGGGGSASSTANHYAALLAQVQAQQDAAARRAEELARQKQQAAQAAYDKNMGYLNEAYANRSNLLQQNYNDALAQLQASYDSGARGVNRNADSAQQQAYINYMMSKRDLPQALAAQGLTGGMSESALAGMYNSYGNNRNTIDRGRNESLAALLDTLNSNRSSALQSYNSQLSAAEQQKMAYQMQLEQALANGSAEILQNKYDTLQNLDNAYAQHRRSRRDLRRPALKQKRSPPLHDPQTGRSRPGHSAACLCPHRGKPLLWLDGCCKPYWEWTSFPRGNTVLLPGSPAKLPHTFFEDPMACAPYSVNLMGARTRRHASAMDAVPHPLPSVMFPTVPGLSGVMPAKEIPLSDIVVWYTCPAVFPMGP